MPRIRLLQVIPDLPVGGAERMLQNLVTHLDRSRYDVTVVSLYDPRHTVVERELAADGIEVVHLGKRVGFDARMFPAIGAVVRRLRPDVVHTHRQVLQYALPALWGRFRGAVAHTVHNMAEQEAPRAVRAAQWVAFRTGVAPVAIGTLVAGSIERVYGMPPRAVIPHGIPVARFARAPTPRAAWRSAHGIGPSTVVLACVARLSVQKNVTLLLRALASAGDLGDVLLLVVGDGPLGPTLEAQARSLGIEGRVRFTGARPDVPDVLSAADVFVLPSLWEGNPLSVMEAMAAGLPVVASAVGGVPEFVTTGGTGFLVPPGDERALADALRRVIVDPALRARLALEASRVAQERFDVPAMVAAYDRLYQELLASRDAG